MERILEVKNLNVSLNTYAGEIKAVRNVSFNLNQGETLVVVGESGCGKTIMSKSIIQLLPQDITIINKDAKINFKGNNILSMKEKELENVRGEEISMIFQDSTTHLNPTMTIGEQVSESLVIHKKVKKQDLKKETLKMLERVKISNPDERVKQYPHEFSGGMRQRVMIAIALACSPSILIADEPTTALDVTIQADIMELIGELQKELNTSVMLITHDLGIAAEVADRIQVMYAGEIIETGSKKEIFENPQHPYTWALLRSVPSMKSVAKEELYSLKGTPPDLLATNKGCAFAPRCDYAMKVCENVKPDNTRLSNTQYVACWLKHALAPQVEIPDSIRRA